MGVWFYFSGGFDFNKKVEPEFREGFNYYAREKSWDDPNAPYGTSCPWFIDENDKMTLGGTKFGDHGVWLDYVTEKFLKPEGYSLSGEITFTTETSDKPEFLGKILVYDEKKELKDYGLKAAPQSFVYI